MSKPDKSRKEIRLLHLITGLDVGGAEKVVLDLARFASPTFKVFVLSISDRRDMLSTFHEKGVQPTVLGLGKSAGGLKSAIGAVSSFVKDQKIDVVHAHLFHAGLVASMVKIGMPNIRVVFTPHSILIEKKWRELALFSLKGFRARDILFSEMHPERYYNADVVRIPNGIEIAPLTDTAKFEVFTFICVGSLRPVKNHLAFLRKLEGLKLSMPYQVLIVGGGELETEVRAVIDDLNLDQVKLLGLRTDVADLLAKSHVFVMPSLWEGLPMSILEAGLAELPVLSTPVGNIPSVIGEDTGYLSKWENFPEIMHTIVDNYSEAQDKGKALRRRVKENYSIQRVVERHEELYTEVLE